ncbi:hypothetical protein HOLleu_16103 [Holothuria leucospilota]|uniref:Uncharacterized protein n=1 Tax=Holothuria leucospilota TaxID=206669 RepID=A0A9Q1C5N0_HOLLE|nr:hypothetical protein HOLleu_16103 [Holothuria leucospilota]
MGLLSGNHHKRHSDEKLIILCLADLLGDSIRLKIKNGKLLLGDSQLRISPTYFA